MNDLIDEIDLNNIYYTYILYLICVNYYIIYYMYNNKQLD